MEACSAPLLQWAGWITGMVLGISGYGFTMLGWKIRDKQARALAKTKDIHDAIDKVVAALNELEDSAYVFWADPDSSVRADQLILLHRRCVIRINQLKHLNNFPLPVDEIIEMRRQATLDAESHRTPLAKGSARLRKLSRAVENIIQSEPLQKSWNI